MIVCSNQLWRLNEAIYKETPITQSLACIFGNRFQNINRDVMMRPPKTVQNKFL